QPFALVQDLADLLAGFAVPDHRAERHLDLEVRAGAPGAVRPHTVAAPFGGVDRRELQVVERVETGVTDQHDRAAPAAIAARRAATRHVLLAPERDATVPTTAATDVEAGLVEKDHGMGVGGGRRGGAAEPRRGLLGDRNDVDELAALAAVLEGDHAVDLGEQRVVTADPDVA